MTATNDSFENKKKKQNKNKTDPSAILEVKKKQNKKTVKTENSLEAHFSSTFKALNRLYPALTHSQAQQYKQHSAPVFSRGKMQEN